MNSNNNSKNTEEFSDETADFDTVSIDDFFKELEAKEKALDISPEMVSESKQKFGHLPNVDFKVGNVENIELPDNSFDQVICMAVVEYLDKPDLMLAEIARVLRPNGIAIITVPKKFHVDNLTIKMTTPIRYIGKKLLGQQSDAVPRLRLQPEELDKQAEKAGLKFIDGRQYQFTLFPYPLTRVAPDFFMKLNLPFEKWTQTRNGLLSFLGHGYIGCYQKK